MPTIAVNQIEETDLSQAMSSGIGAMVNQAFESDLSQSITEQKRKVIGQNTEADAAQTFDRDKIRAVLQAGEADTAQRLAKPIPRIVETELAQPIQPRISWSGQVASADDDWTKLPPGANF